MTRHQVREETFAEASEMTGELPPVFGDHRVAVLGNHSIITGKFVTVPMWETAVITPGERLIRTTIVVDRELMMRHAHNVERNQPTTIVTASGAAQNQLMLNSHNSHSYNMPPTIATIAAASVLPAGDVVPAGRVSLNFDL